MILVATLWWLIVTYPSGYRLPDIGPMSEAQCRDVRARLAGIIERERYTAILSDCLPGDEKGPS